jgi:hypothetical protein
MIKGLLEARLVRDILTHAVHRFGKIRAGADDDCGDFFKPFLSACLSTMAARAVSVNSSRFRNEIWLLVFVLYLTHAVCSFS